MKPGPATGAVVMSGGVLSVDLDSIGQPLGAAILLWFAAASWAFLVAVVGMRALTDAQRFARESRSPAALTGVAGSAVLGSAFAARGYYTVAAVLLGVAAVSWVLLLVPVLRYWTTPVTGVSFLLTAATQSLAVLGAILAARSGATWLLGGAIAVLLLGLALYVVTVVHFSLRELLTEHGDHWVTGGALAISALACAKIAKADDVRGWLPALHGFFDVLALIIWCLAMLWLAPLIVTEAVRPRLSYDVRRWATVFPLGMYAACSFAVGQVNGIAGFADFARVWTWVALAVSVVVLAGLIRGSVPTSAQRPTDLRV